jgi:hypothetical protein
LAEQPLPRLCARLALLCKAWTCRLPCITRLVLSHNMLLDTTRDWLQNSPSPEQMR